MTCWPLTCPGRPGPCRLRAGIGPNLASRLYGPLSETGDFMMARLMLAGIKTRAEKLAAAHERAGWRSYPRGGLW
jgi:hypothetical protein